MVQSRTGRTGRRGTQVAWLLVTVLGCSSEAIRSGESLEPVVGSPVEIAATPEVQVGVLDGDSLQELHGVVTPFWMPHGKLVVPLAGSSTIRTFDENGNHLASVGGKGEGPSEFRAVSSAWSRGDVVEVFDADLRRVTRLHPDGGIETIQLSGTGLAQRVVPHAFDGGWIGYGVQQVGEDGRDRMAIHAFDDTGGHIGLVAQLFGMQRYFHSNGSAPVPLSPWAWITGHGNEIYVAEGLDPRLTVVDREGVEMGRITWEVPSGSIADLLPVVVDSAVARMPEAGRAAFRAAIEEAPPPDIPALGGLIVDELGFIWIRPFEALRHAAVLGGLGRPGPGGVWQVFSPAGVEVGEVSMPEELEPSQITADRVVGIRRDALGVESVQVYGLKRAGRD